MTTGEAELEAAQTGDGIVDIFQLGLQQIKEKTAYSFRKGKEEVGWLPGGHSPGLGAVRKQ